MFDAPSKCYLTSVNKIWRHEEREGLGCLTWRAIVQKFVISVGIRVVKFMFKRPCIFDK